MGRICAPTILKLDDYARVKATYSIFLLMRNLWDDDQLHHQFRLVDRESGRVLEESIEIQISTRIQPYALELLQSEGQLNKSV